MPNVPFQATAGDVELRFLRLKHFREVLPKEQEASPIMDEPPAIPVLEVPGDMGEPPVTQVEVATTEPENDLDRLGLPAHVVARLEKGGMTRVADLRLSIVSENGYKIKQIKGIGPSLYDDITRAILNA